MNLAELLDTEILRTQQELAENIQASGQRATGKTIAALRSESAPLLARLYGPAHISFLETPPTPSADPDAKPGRAFVASIREWLEAKGLVANGSAYGLALYILRKGTRLYQGRDPRFGKPTGTIRDVLAASRARVRTDLSTEVRRSLRSELFAYFASKTAY
jgi:hypothetical protein